jgi:formate--tetrahydrofolate ligase
MESRRRFTTKCTPRGDGGRDLAEAVVRAAEMPSEFKLLYPDEMAVEEKIETIVREIMGGTPWISNPRPGSRLPNTNNGDTATCHLYGQDAPLAQSRAETDGPPDGFRVPVREVRLSAGAGFLYVLCGTMMTMPGLPAEPAGNKVDIDENGRIVGLF